MAEEEHTQWSTHYTYVKSKVEQEKAAVAAAKEAGLDMRVVVPGYARRRPRACRRVAVATAVLRRAPARPRDARAFLAVRVASWLMISSRLDTRCARGRRNLVVGPVASQAINGTMTRLRDIMTGTNTLKGAADLAVVHVTDVVATHAKCMADDNASGRYIVAPPEMVRIEDVFSALRELYPSLPVAALEHQDIASGVSGAARKIDSRVGSLGIELKPYKTALKDAIDSMIDNKLIAAGA